MAVLEAVIRRLVSLGNTINIPTAIDHARQTKFDGSLVIHFRGGVPLRMELGRPTQVDLEPPTYNSPLTDSEIRPTLSSNTT